MKSDGDVVSPVSWPDSKLICFVWVLGLSIDLGFSLGGDSLVGDSVVLGSMSSSV